MFENIDSFQISLLRNEKVNKSIDFFMKKFYKKKAPH